MLPKRLEIQAFGPYVEKQIIDFSSFEKHRLFLIEGETGSGKTMLLDAMTYALYGKSSGGQREDMEHMRSRFALPSLDTIIDFQFAIQGHIYRFFRGVSMRKKRNGEIAYRNRVDAGEIINGTYTPFFENPKQRIIEEKAEELIGLSYLQFVQVMLLPQGKFEQFLTSRSEDKQEILKTLFQMERWSVITAYLNDQLYQLHQQLDEKKQRIQADLHSLEEADRNAAIQTKNAVIQQREKEEAEKNQMEQQQKQLQEILLQQKEYTRLQEEYQERKKRYEAEHQLWDSMQEKQKQLIEWNQLFELRRCYQEQQRLDTINTKRHTQLIAANQALKKAQSAQDGLRVLANKQTSLEDLIKQEEQQCKEYEQQLELVQAYQTIQKQHQAALAKQKASQQTRQELQQERTSLKQQQQVLQESHTQYEQQHAKHQAIQEQWQLYALAKQQQDRYEQQLKQYHDNQQSRKAAQMEATRRSEVRQQRYIKHEQMYQQFLESSALQLAQQLEEGKPCPVCGSPSHPHPAIIKQTAVDILQLRACKQELEESKQQEEEQRIRCEKYQALQTQLQQQCEESKTQIRKLLKKDYQKQDHEAINAAYQELRQQQEADQKQMQRLYALQEALSACEDQLQIKTLEVQQCVQETLVLETRMDALMERQGMQEKAIVQQQLEEIKQQLATNMRQLHDVKLQQEQIALDYQRAQLSQQTSEKEWKLAQQEADTHRKQYERQLQAQKATQQDLIDLPSETEIQKQSEQVQRYFLNLKQLNEHILSLHKQIKAMTLPVVDDVTSQLQELSQQLNQKRELCAQLQAKQEVYERTLKKIQRLGDELEQEEPRFLRMQHFVRALRGDNSIGIERYVLGVLLDSITTQANRLLQHIHEGRYQIFRSDDTTGRTRKYGLELSIFDTYSMEARNVVSLSGGEKFLVSLAMSLALSMVVQARNGGIHFDCLFIDEGFGTLDEHSIADALAILQTMTQGKGMIGIISHVEILKENIPYGIEVKKSREGSSLHMRKEG